MLKKAITVFSLLLLSSCSHTVTEFGAETKDFHKKEQTNIPLATGEVRACKGYALYFIPYGDTTLNFETITEDAIRGGTLKFDSLKDIDLSGNVNIRIETTKSILGKKKCIIVDGNVIVPELNKRDDNSINTQKKTINQKQKKPKAQP